MTIVNILAPLTGSKDDNIVLDIAFAAAKPFGAHVSAVFSRPDVREAIPITEVPLLPDVIQELVDIQEDMTRKAKAAAHASFRNCAKMADARIAPLADASEDLTASYREVVGHQPWVMEEHAFLADLIIFPPLTHEFNQEAHETFVRLLTRCDRPVLLSPYSPRSQIGKKIAVGWDGSQPSAHAMTAALAFLEKAEKVELLSIRRSQSPARLEIARAKEYLALHGVRADERLIEDPVRSVGEALLDAAVTGGCDMLVAGGYGHSRLSESIFGGVTSYITSHPALPIFMMH